jgi:VanZ family protein
LDQGNLNVKKLLSIVPRWLPALFFMTAIFIFSSQPSDDLPNFQNWDYFLKKTGHAVGYGLLALSYFHFFNYDKKRYWLAWLLAVLFSATDEFHQSFVPGRHPSIIDVLVFDNLGAVTALWLYFMFHRTEATKKVMPQA